MSLGEGVLPDESRDDIIYWFCKTQLDARLTHLHLGTPIISGSLQESVDMKEYIGFVKISPITFSYVPVPIT